MVHKDYRKCLIIIIEIKSLSYNVALMTLNRTWEFSVLSHNLLQMVRLNTVVQRRFGSKTARKVVKEEVMRLLCRKNGILEDLIGF